jgi:hypothetical protein
MMTTYFGEISHSLSEAEAVQFLAASSTSALAIPFAPRWHVVSFELTPARQASYLDEVVDSFEAVLAVPLPDEDRWLDDEDLELVEHMRHRQSEAFRLRNPK